MVSRMTIGELPETWWNIVEFIRVHIIFLRLYYISDNELRELCKEEIGIVNQSIDDYSNDSFDSYNQADLLAALLSGGSEKAAEYALNYNGDAECSDREVKGYLFSKDFQRVTLL